MVVVHTSQASSFPSSTDCTTLREMAPIVGGCLWSARWSAGQLAKLTLDRRLSGNHRRHVASFDILRLLLLLTNSSSLQLVE